VDILLTFRIADAQTIAIWSTIEPGLGIMAGCLATLRPLFRSFLRSALTYAQHGRSVYGTDKTASNGTVGRNRSHSNVEDDAVLFSNPNYLKGNSIDAGYRIPKEPWRPGGRWAISPMPAANGADESIEMHARMVEEAAHVYDTSRVVSNRPTAPDAAYTRQYYV
jgi:hypothetical protein